MSKGIPEHADLIRAARQDSHFSGAISIARMPRFSEYLASNEGLVEVDIWLGTDEHHQAFLQGTASARVQVLCQRCMQPMWHDMQVSFRLLLVESEYQLEGLQDDVDVIVLTEIPTSLYSIVEDELILGFSLVPMHDEALCEASAYMQDERQSRQQEQQAEKTNPFTVLKDLKIDG
jgi:uncharacterized protein